MIECSDEDPKQRPTFDQILFLAKKNSMKIDLGRLTVMHKIFSIPITSTFSLVEDLQKRLQEYTDKLEHLGNGFRVPETTRF